MKLTKPLILITSISLLSACSNKNNDVANVPAAQNEIQNTLASYIPLQCYTKTQGVDKVHNPCFSCHTTGTIPNYLDDSEFQLLYDFRDSTRKNPWTNAFKDRSQAVADISNNEILEYIRQSNYFDETNAIKLANLLSSEPPANWDINDNRQWDGYIPDTYFNFDSEGFDQTPSGTDTGWRAFGYYPFLGTFWPTNGNISDVLIRLAPEFRQDTSGKESRAVYKLNLAVVESMIRQKNIPIDPTDEALFQVDLNKNGQVDTATEVVFDWAPLDNRYMSYVGKAKELFEENKLEMAAGLYPTGTEFLHTVRYVDFNETNEVSLSARVKELRYAKKYGWNNYTQLKNVVLAEAKETVAFPDALRTIKGDAEFGVSNNQGWAYQGFIEDQNGELRPQSYEESLTCVGCHSGVGTTTDSSFSFPRRLGNDAHQQGWFHWTQKTIHGISEPKWKDDTYDYTKYLIENHSANEFRTNAEVEAKFFDSSGNLKQEVVNQLHEDISVLLTPSFDRAMELNKAYKVIVDEQSYIYGRDPHVKPLDNVWDVLPEGEETGITEAVITQPLQ
ncbi:hypothetical protein [Thiomicrorhabdus indica]|uniref:hypothetical protein n=1 Tax=Thiomicrorhabdus indica TaxID=2267253 RepID=UPI002AA8A593|nr:hypothetical protein [Thiomicrorhabdus indica]